MVIKRPRAVMSIDVEDWFQVENLKSAIPRHTWDEHEYRVEANTDRILTIFADTSTTATFFCLGWVAERSPALIRRIHDAGHEIASHGYGHELVYDQTPATFREDVVRAKAILEDTTGSPILGYRAPSFSITEWALRILASTGHRYDSSVFPVSGHDRYAQVSLDETDRVSTKRHRIEPVYAQSTDGGSTILEIPIATLRVGGRIGRTLPWGGGGYFRVIPFPLFAAGFRHGARHGTAPMFYLHPWEIDPQQPHVPGIPRSYAFRHYVNLHRTAGRLKRLCESVQFGRADELLGLR